MNKRVIAVVLAGAMAASQLAGPVEVLATNTAGEVEATASETPEKVLGEGTLVDTSVEAAKDNSIQTQAEKKAILANDGKVYGRTDTDVSDATEIQTTDYGTVTDLMIDGDVTSIANNLFKNQTSLKKLAFKNTGASGTTNTALVTIGEGAFWGTSIETVTLPAGLVTIKNGAFQSISTLTTIDFSATTKFTTIEANAFKGNTLLTNVTLPDTVTTIAEGAFEDTGLTTIRIPSLVTSISSSTFMGTASLGTVDFQAATTLTRIGDNAFANSGLVAVEIPATVTSIGEGAFKGTASLANADLSKAAELLTIGKNAFQTSGLQTVKIPGKVTTIDEGAFTGAASLTTIDLSIALALADIKLNAFMGASELAGVVDMTPTKVTAIGDSAFAGTKITEVKLPATLLTIGDNAFKGISTLGTANFGVAALVTRIGISAFEGSGLTALDLAPIGTAVDVETKAFQDNANLATVTLPEKMTALKAEVLAGTALTALEINKDAATVDLTALPNTLETITVAAGNTTFAAAGGVLYSTGQTNLKAFPKGKGGEFELPATVTTIDADAVKGNKKLTKVSLANGSVLTDIEIGAFEGTTALTLLDLIQGTSLTNIKDRAFKDGGLQQMYLGETTKDFTVGTGIGTDAFASVATTKVAKFFTNSGTEVTPGTALDALELKWAKLKEPAKGGWIFYAKPTKPAIPKATANYTDMKLEGLTLSTDYNIVVDGKTEVLGADVDGKIAIKKEWGGKTIKISTTPTITHLESEAQSLAIKSIYTVTMDSTATDIAEGESVSRTAADIPNKTFIKWEAVGVELPDVAVKTITFIMPANDVTLTKVYKTTNTTAPSAAADYAEMKLTGLSPNESYTIEGKEVVADSNGKMAIEKEWGGKSITIVKNETETETESPAQTLQINAIHSIIVGETEVAISVKDQPVTITAPALEGHQFKEWTDGFDTLTITNGSKTTETITFTMLDKDVTLKAAYTKIVVTKPEDMVYDGEKEVSVELDVPLADFDGIKVGDVELVKDRDYTVSEAPVATLSTGKTIIKFTKTYLDSLEKGVNAFKVVLKSGKEVGFSVNVVVKPEKPPVVFPDVNAKEWYAKAVDYVSSKEYMTGFANGNFGPADILGRGQFASILHRMAGSPVQNYENLFADVPNGTFYTMPVVWAQKNNVIKGYQNGNFGPSDSMTREQLVTMLYRYTQIKGGNTVARASIENYPDKAKVSGFAVEAMQWGVAEGLVSGDNGTLNPQGLASRAVAATLIQRFEMKQKPPVTPPVTPPTP